VADKASTPIAGQLLRVLATRQRTSRLALPTVAHYAGSRNVLADTHSHSFRRFHYGSARGLPSKSDDEFLTSFNQTFSLSAFSQMTSWRLVRLESAWSSLVISTLHGQKLPMPQWTEPRARPTGATGAHDAPGLPTTNSSPTPPSPSKPTLSWLSLPESVLALLVTADKLDVKPSPRPCAMSPKSLFWPTTMTHTANQDPS
jgi:hypothetical protein